MPLKQCPFCNGKAYSRVRVQNTTTLVLSVQCEDCTAKIHRTIELKDSDFDYLEGEFVLTVKGWNKRDDDDPS